MADRAYLERLTKRLTDEGRLIEAGWVGLRLAAIADNAPAAQLEEMRMAFMGGAAHLFASITSILDPGEEPTADDLARMNNIHNELRAFEEEFKRKHGLGKRAEPPPQPAPTLGDQPIERGHVDAMNVCAHMLDKFFNGDAQGDARKMGFVLLLFKFGEQDTSRCNFISNGADRRDVVTLFKEMIARFEGQPEMEGRA